MNTNLLAFILRVSIFVLNLILGMIIDTSNGVSKLHKTATNWLKEIEDESN